MLHLDLNLELSFYPVDVDVFFYTSASKSRTIWDLKNTVF